MKPIVSRDRIQTLGPHPEEAALLRGRLEGWPLARSGLWPPFETRARARSSGRGLIARYLAIAAAWSTLAISAVIAGSPEEDFRAGLSAFNGGDFAAALRLWRPLAEGNDARSQAGIGFMYHRGLGVKTDDAQAAFWLRKAAEQGQAEGQMMLGTLYFFGLGVPQNYAAAYAWCELAQDNGQGEAQICRDAALQSLTEDAQLRDAFRMVRELRERFGHAGGQ